MEEIIQEPYLENVEVDTFLRQPIVRVGGVRRLNPRVASRCEAGERLSAKVASWCESSLRFTWKPAWRLQEAVFEVSDLGKKVLRSRRWTQCASPCGWELGEVCSLWKIGSLRATFGLCCRSGEASCAASTGNGDGFRQETSWTRSQFAWRRGGSLSLRLSSVNWQRRLRQRRRLA